MITVKDIAFVRFTAPDLDKACEFLRDFGFIENGHHEGSVFFRCAGEAHHSYVLDSGEPRFVGLAFEASSFDDLETLSRSPGASAVEPTGEPGGGHRVILTDPNGFRVEVVHGVEKMEPLDMRQPLVLNYAHSKQRFNTTQRPSKGAVEMRRLGHVGLTVLDINQTIDWYSKTLGMILTDAVEAGPQTLLAFVRCGFPGVFSDHHALALFQGDQGEFGHAAFEVQDFDAVGLGHYHMKQAKWQHAWGIGRHTLGSQIFDYWVDPWGRMIEHFADSDLFDEQHPSTRHRIEDTSIEIWGPPLPEGKGPKRERVTEGSI